MDFVESDGVRSSQAAGKKIFSAAAAAVDQGLAEQIEKSPEWRKRYLGPVREAVVAGVSSPKNALRIAEEGLAATREQVVMRSDEGDMNLGAVFDSDGPTPRTETLTGHGNKGQRLEIPYRGSMLRGEALRSQLDRWVERGVIEPSAAANVRAVLDNPEWLDLTDLKIALLGAASEMGPLEALCSWGAHVLAIDLPRPALWERILEAARSGSGKLSYPTRDGGPGIDLLEAPDQAYRWLASFEGPMTVGNYVYADGARFVLLSAIVDALLEKMIRDRSDTSLAYLATPTDVFAVGADVVDGAKGSTGPIGRLLNASSGGRLYERSYQEAVPSEDGRVWGIYDCLVPQQGANYALAKAIQRWRAVEARSGGTLMSANVAPATRTRSVVKNRILAAAYSGARKYGVEIFQPDTSRALMAALLVHDLRNPEALANPSTPLPHPYDLLVDGAAHGGLWRSPHSPRSVLPLAVVRGAFKRRS